MTLENTQYGPPWVCCTRCGVTQPIADLEFRLRPGDVEGLDAKRWVCKRVAKCTEWLIELETARKKDDPVLVVQPLRAAVDQPKPLPKPLRAHDDLLGELHGVRK